MITLVPITDAAHLVHGPIGCAGNSWDGRGSLSSGPTLYRRGFTTDLSGQELIFGGERRLYQAVVEIAARYRPSAVFVYATCVTAMTGDDLEAVCAEAARDTGLPVVPVPAPGFAGSKNFGNGLAGQVLLDHVIGTAEPEFTTPLDVNLVGEYNVAGELWDVLPVLDRIGLRVLSRITGDARYRDVAVAHRAKATMVVCSRALSGLADGLSDRYGIPWFEGSFYGIRAMSDSLRSFARLLDAATGTPDGIFPASAGCARPASGARPVGGRTRYGPAEAGRGLRERVEAVIAEEEARAYAALAPYRERLRGVRAVLYTGGVKSWSMVSALQDIGVQVVASGATKSTDGDVERMRALLGPSGEVITDGRPARLIRILRDTGADVLIAGGRNQYTAIKARLPFLDVNQERHVPFAGYTGAVELARRLDLALHNPVWRSVRAPAPWDRPAPAPPNQQSWPGGQPSSAEQTLPNQQSSPADRPLLARPIQEVD